MYMRIITQKIIDYFMLLVSQRNEKVNIHVFLHLKRCDMINIWK